MARRKTTAVDAPPPPRVMQLLNDFAIGSEMGTFDLGEGQLEIARVSPAFRALIRSSVESPGHDDLHSLAKIWDRAGRPEGKSPREYMVEYGGIDEDGREFQDLGEDGVFVPWESAGWYVNWLDPENFTTERAVEHLY